MYQHICHMPQYVQNTKFQHLKTWMSPKDLGAATYYKDIKETLQTQEAS